MNWITTILVEKGKRLTTPRIAVSDWLLSNDGVFSPKDIIAALPELDRVSVYRTVDVLAALDIIHPTSVLAGHQYYELHDATAHHHHVMCTACKKADCIPCLLPSHTIHGFQDVHHEVHFTGVCLSCTV